MICTNSAVISLLKVRLKLEVILDNESTVGANHKFFTLTLNGLKAIPANEGNHVEL